MSSISYSPAVFDKIGTLQGAIEIFEAQKAKNPNLLDLFRRVFMDSGKNNAVEISLLHKHFTIPPRQVLVDLNNVTAPWTIYDLTINRFRSIEPPNMRMARFMRNLGLSSQKDAAPDSCLSSSPSFQLAQGVLSGPS